MEWQTQQICKQLAQHIIDGVSGRAVADLILKDGKCAPVEGDVLDYKEQVDLRDSICVAEVCKDIVAFHNRFGGYLVLGVKELAAERFVVKGIEEPLDVELLKNKIRDFTGERISVIQSILPAIDAAASQVEIAIIYIRKGVAARGWFIFERTALARGLRVALFFARRTSSSVSPMRAGEPRPLRSLKSGR